MGVAKWQKTQDSTQDTVMANQDLPKIVDLDEALATMHEATRLGADRFSPRFIKSLPQNWKTDVCGSPQRM